MIINILLLGVSEQGGVSHYMAPIVQDIKNIKYFVPCARKQNYKKLYSLYSNNINIVDFDQYYNFKTIYNTLKKLDKIVHMNGIQIIHAHVLRFGILATLYKKIFNKKIKIVYTGHGSRYIQKKRKLEKYIFKKFEEFVNKTSDKIIFIRQLEYQQSISQALVLPSKAILLLTQYKIKSTDENNFSLRKKYNITTLKIIAMVGSVYDIKQPYFFCKIAKKFLNKFSNCTFVWIGGGDLLDKLRKYVAKEGMEQKIKFIGQIAPKFMQKVWQDIDILLLTSNIEIFPLIVLEAYHSQTVVISTNFEGVEEVIKDRKTGLVFDMTNSDTAVAKLEYILHNDIISNQLKKSGYEFYIKNFSNVNYMIKKHEEIYKEVINDNN